MIRLFMRVAVRFRLSPLVNKYLVKMIVDSMYLENCILRYMICIECT